MIENIKAFISISMCDPSQTLVNIREIEGIQKLYEVSGRYDAIAVIDAPIDELNNTINRVKNVKGVTAINSIIILKEIYK